MTTEFEKIIELLVEQELSKLHPYEKGQVVDLDTSSKLANKISNDISSLVKDTYGSMGGFPDADDPKGVLKRFTNFLVTDIDEDPEPDSAILYTNWDGSKKASALVSDGSPEARKKLKSMMYSFFSKPGSWIEVSGAPANVLIKKMGFSTVDNEDEVRKILNNIKDIEWHGEHPSGISYGDGWYSRKIGGKEETKIIVGNPPKTTMNEQVDEDDDIPLYHITFYKNLPQISSQGLKGGGGSNFGMGYEAHSNKGIFLTDEDGINYWAERFENIAVHSSDNILDDGFIPVVLRVDPSALSEDNLEEDEIGSRDARNDAFIYYKPIKPAQIKFWDGESWESLSNWEELDPELSVDEEELEDDEGNEETYYLFKHSNPLIP